MRQVKHALAVILLLLMCVGCSTIGVHAAPGSYSNQDPCSEFPPYVYGGTLADLFYIVNGIRYIPESLWSPLISIYGLIDLPLSLTADTVVLPVAVYRQLVECEQRRQDNALTKSEIE